MTDEELDSLWQWMNAEWLANYNEELPAHQYAKAVIALQEIEKQNGNISLFV